MLGETPTQADGVRTVEKLIFSHQNSSVSALDSVGPFPLIVLTLYCMLLSDSVLNVRFNKSLANDQAA